MGSVQRKTFLLAVVLGGAILAAFPGAVAAQEMERQAECTWDQPNVLPAAVDYYQVELQQLVGEIILDSKIFERVEERSLEVTVSYGYVYRFRVKCVDVNGQVGPWSLWSNEHSPETLLGEHLGQ